VSAAAPAAAAALEGVRPVSYWLDRPERPARVPALEGSTTADLVVVGGGYTGLWAALQAKEEQPGRDVVLLEAGRCGDAASGRNGGFCSTSLTHGLANGAERCPEDLARLERLGRANLDGIERTLARHGIDCSWERTGELDVAVAPWQVGDLAATARQFIRRVFRLGDDALRALEKRGAILGQRELAAVALDQVRIQRAFELAQPFAHRGL